MTTTLPQAGTGRTSTPDIWNISDLVSRLAALYPEQFRGQQGEAWGQEYKRQLQRFTSRQLSMAWSSVMNDWTRAKAPPPPAFAKEAREILPTEPAPSVEKKVATKGNIRNRHATAAMMRALVRARQAKDPEAAHEPILAIAAFPEKWPDWLDEHGDDEWKSLPKEKKRAIQDIEIWY